MRWLGLLVARTHRADPANRRGSRSAKQPFSGTADALSGPVSTREVSQTLGCPCWQRAIAHIGTGARRTSLISEADSSSSVRRSLSGRERTLDPCSEGSLMPDYPQMLTPVDHIEPVPRRIRAILAGEVVLDTTKALYVWEWPNYPQYYVPIADVNRALLVDEQHTERLHRGSAQLQGLRVGQVVRPSSARLYIEGSVAGTVRFDWGALDAWFEEDEEVFVHPRNPYARVDALRSTRRVRIELDGTLLADSSSPVMLFETGFPTRYYFQL